MVSLTKEDFKQKNLKTNLFFFFQVDDECLNCLVKYEKLLFGIRVTDTEELWM